MNNITEKKINELSFEIIGAAIEVHRFVGRGLLESVYHKCMMEELSHRKINFLTEMKVPLIYKEKELNLDFRCDLYVENCLVVELKSVSEMNKIHEAQLMTYMKLLKAPKGILINFNSFNLFNNGQRTYVNDLYKKLPNV